MAPRLPSVENFARATLRPRRKASGLSMENLAEKLDVSVPQVAGWENGWEAMPSDMFARWLVAVGVTDPVVAGLLQAAHAQTEEK